MFTPKQLKAARAMAGLSLDDLSGLSEINKTTINNFETGKSKLNQSSLEHIYKALTASGIEFIESGVREVTHKVNIFAGKEAFIKLLDDVYSKTQKGDEVLYFCVNNGLTPQESLDRQINIRAKGVKFRFLVKEGDTFLRFPLEEYRYLQGEYFSNSPILVYGEYVAFAPKTVDYNVVVWLPSLTDTLRGIFNALWQAGAKPTKSTAETQYA